MNVLSTLHTDIRQILEDARNRARTAINSAVGCGEARTASFEKSE
jgi:hypothetical protein